MAVDKVKPLKIEDSSSGTQIDFGPTETDPSEDYLASAGVAYGNQDDIRTFRGDGTDGTTDDLMFEDKDNSPISLSSLRNPPQSAFYSMSINPGGEPSSPFMKADNNDYQHLGSTIFLGTNKVGTPINMIVSLEAEKSGDIGKDVDIKIFDATTGNTLAEQTGITLSATRTVEDLGTISNLPTGQVAIELQGRKSLTNGGNGLVFGFKDVL